MKADTDSQVSRSITNQPKEQQKHMNSHFITLQKLWRGYIKLLKSTIEDAISLFDKDKVSSVVQSELFGQFIVSSDSRTSKLKIDFLASP